MRWTGREMTRPDDAATPTGNVQGRQTRLLSPSPKLIRHAPASKVQYFFEKPNRPASLIRGAVLGIKIRYFSLQCFILLILRFYFNFFGTFGEIARLIREVGVSFSRAKTIFRF